MRRPAPPQLDPLRRAARATLLAGAALALAALPARAATAGGEIDPDRLAGLVARSIGPAGTSGRVTAVQSLPGDPHVIWVGAAAGGVWRSLDGGVTWQPRFDQQPVHSIGALAIDTRQPDVVWVGTGEANLRNSVARGDGVYRTRDGGATWQHLGLERTAHVARLLLDPRASETALVCATGSEWSEGPDRGVYKTTDGGRSWQKVLYVDPRTGCGDLAMDPQNPDHLLAGMWQFRRWPYAMESGGPGSGLHVSWDGGATWRRLQPEEGLPEGELGRIGVAFSPSDPRVAYALVEAETSELLRSEDGGRTWTTVDDDPKVAPRPFYFGQIRVDPRTPDHLYRLDQALWESVDGGTSFTAVPGAVADVHGDFHDLWIDPRDPRRWLVAEDGGVALSDSGGDTFRFVGNLPLSQPYHVALDDDQPYHVYVGLQDNGSWRGPAALWQTGGLHTYHWQQIGDGDGFTAVPARGTSERGYALWQGGHVARWDLRTGEQRGIDPAPPLDAHGKPSPRLRFNWNAGFAVDPFEADTIYLGSQFVHRSRDGGASWETVSPDLTTNDPDWQEQDESGGLTLDVTSAESYTTIVAIAPSARERGVLWVGSDDGRVHVSRDGGKSWTSVERNLPGAPKHGWVTHLVPGRHADGVAYLTLDDHRRGDESTYVFATADYGRSWRRLPAAGVRGAALAIAEDTVDAQLLFLGTEYGLWVSGDGGARWTPMKRTIPTVAVIDLAIQPRTGDLVIATHGRGVYVLDDLSPLRSVSPATLREPLHLFAPPPAQQHWEASEEGGFGLGAAEFRGENAPYGALLTWSLDGAGLPLPDPEKERQRREDERRRQAAGSDREERPVTTAAETAGSAAPAGVATRPAAAEKPGATAAAEATARPGAAGAAARAEEEREPKVDVVVTDATGAVVRTFRAPAVRGIDRAVWDLKRDPPRALPKSAEEEATAPAEEPGGPEVPPGDYTVTVKFRGRQASAPLRVLPDPRSSNTPAQWQAREAAVRELVRLQDALAAAIWSVRRAREDVALVQDKQKERLRDGGQRDQDALDADPLVAAGDELLDALDALERTLWVPPETSGIPPETDALAVLSYAASYPESGLGPPTPNDLAWLAQARQRVAAATRSVDAFFADKVAPFRARAEAAGLVLLGGAAPAPAKPKSP